MAIKYFYITLNMQQLQLWKITLVIESFKSIVWVWFDQI